MPTVLDRPEVVETRPPALPSPPVRERRTTRWLRWSAWLISAAAVAAVIAIAIVANVNDPYSGATESRTPPAPVGTTTVELEEVLQFEQQLVTVVAPTFTFTPAAPGPDYVPRLGFGEEATVTPVNPSRLVEQAPGSFVAPVTQFMEEATTNSSFETLLERQLQSTESSLLDLTSGELTALERTIVYTPSMAVQQADADRLTGLAEFYGESPEYLYHGGHPDMKLPPPTAL